jgi:thioredoxin 2
MAEKVKVICPNCGTTNNFPLDSAGKSVVCGRCRNPLPVPGTVLELAEQAAVNLIQRSGLPILIDFYSPTCGPCVMMHSLVERLAKRRAGELIVVKVNTDNSPGLAGTFNIHGVPTFVIISKGAERGRTSGAMGETDFSLWVASRT